MKNKLLFTFAMKAFCLCVCFAIPTNAQTNNCEDNSSDKTVNRPLA